MSFDPLLPGDAPAAQGLYSPNAEHDACGVGFVAHIKGKKSHDLIQQALLILKNLDHRGAVGADPLMGDGAGILIQIPDAYLRGELQQHGITLPPYGEYGVGMVFLPKEHASRMACEQEIERAVRAEGQILLGWRNVPVDRDMPMSPTVRAKEPVIRQVFIGRGAGRDGDRRPGAQALHHPQIIRPRDPGLEACARQGILRAVDVSAHHRLQRACCWPIRSDATTVTWPTRAW